MTERRRAWSPGIRYWFEITRTPAGGAPLRIREQWVGVPLPVRRPRPIEGPEPHVGVQIGSFEPVVVDDGVVVLTHEAARALQLFGRTEAAAWWSEAHASGRAPALVFRFAEGRWFPPERAEVRWPELADVDWG